MVIFFENFRSKEFIQGSLSFSLKIIGKLGSWINLLISFNSLATDNFDIFYENLTGKNEIVLNDTYYFYIPVQFSKFCESGYYFDMTK